MNIFAPGDSKPQFLQKIYHFTIEEEQEPGVAVLKVCFPVNLCADQCFYHPNVPVSNAKLHLATHCCCYS